MELHVPLELEGKLAAAASRRGVSVEVLAREALERAVEYDDWFLREVEAGLAQIDAGQTLAHEGDPVALIDRILARHPDPDAVPAHTYDVHDRPTARAAILARVKRRRK